MKYLLFVLLAVSFAYSSTLDDVVVTPREAMYMPANVHYIKLDPGDSLAVDANVVMGPYPLARSGKNSTGSYIRMFTPVGAVATGESLVVDYQILPSYDINDTTASWTAFDTIQALGSVGGADDISASGGVGIVFRLQDIASNATLIMKPPKITVRENVYRLIK